MRRTGMFSTTENIDYSPSTVKIFGGRRLFLLILSVLATVSDLAATVVFAIAGYGAVITVPILLTVVDVLFIVGVCFSNFRFKYAIGVWTAYVAVAVILLSMISLTSSGVEVVMTNAAIAINTVAHAALFVAIVFAGIYPLLKKNNKTKGAMLAVTAVAVILICAFTFFFSLNGYFGQGFVGQYRVVTYRYDEAEDGYIAFSVNQGRSKKVVIPETFNGKKVIGVNSNIFSDKSIDDISLQSKEGLKFISPELLYFFNENLRVGVDRALIDVYRKEYMQSLKSFANNMYPCNLSENETYVTFAYQSYDPSVEIIPTWIGNKGDKFELSYANELEYLAHTDQSNPADLVWCWENNNGKILKNLLTSNGKSLIGSKIENGVDKISVEFNKVFKATVGEDNDDLYEPSDSFKNTVVGDKTYGNRFFTVNTVDGVTSELSREGFDLKWTYKKSDSFPISGMTSLKTALENEEKTLGKTSIDISPEWSLRAPTDLSISADKDSYVYGDTIKLVGSATAPNKDCVLEYRWGEKLYDQSRKGKEYKLDNVHPNQSGTYYLFVEASSPKTSLTSVDLVSIEIVINKKPLNVVWKQPDDMVYDGNSKTVTYSCGQGDLINGDTLDLGFDVLGDSATDANSYTAQASLSGDLGEKYTIASGGTYAYTILPRPTETVWSVDEYIYSGSGQGPSASANDVYGVPLKLTIVGNNKINAGKYTATASLYNKNYALTNTTAKYEIKQKSITVEWEEKDFIYSGAVQYPKVARTSGVVLFESVTNQLVYSGYDSNINAKDGYEVKVSLIEGSNYKFDTEQTKLYNILKRSISAKWTTVRSLTYNGTERGITVSSFTNIVPSDADFVINGLTYEGYGKDAGSYVMEAALSEQASVNYIAADMTCGFEISKREITAAWGNNSFVYDASAHVPQITSLTNVVNADGESAFDGLQYSGEQVNAGSDYVATATLDAQTQKNYTLKNPTCKFAVQRAAVMAVWGNTQFVYDKNAHMPAVNSLKGVVESDRERVMSGLRVSGMQINAGSYYVAIAALDDESRKNYWLANTQCEFSIAKAQAAAVWSQAEIKDGEVIPPTLVIDSTEYGGEVKIVKYTYRDAQGQVIAAIPSENGQYSVSVEIESGNYTLTGLQKTFEIVGFTQEEEVA